MEFATEAGGVYRLTHIPPHEKGACPTALRANRELCLTWDSPRPVHIWRAVNSEPCYTLVAQDVTGGQYRDEGIRFEDVETVTYKITADGDAASLGACVTLNHSTELERQRYRFLIPQLNAVCGGANAPDYLGE